MERFYKRLKHTLTTIPTPEVFPEVEVDLEVEHNIYEIEADPGLRRDFNTIASTEKDRIRSAYLLRGPFQPIHHVFPFTLFGKKKKRFRISWFKDHASWLEYSINKDAAFCLCCYLFKDSAQGLNDSFICDGFRNWKKADRFLAHTGELTSIHNQCQEACQDLINRKQHIDIAISLQSDKVKSDYGIQLSVVIDCVKFLLIQGLAFRGHDESETSKNMGNFLELINFLSSHNDTIKGVFKNSADNNKLMTPSIQKEITNACSVLCTNAIISELGDELGVSFDKDSIDLASYHCHRRTSFFCHGDCKKSLRNRMGDDWMNDCLLTYIEKEIFENLSTEDILKRFQEMKTRRISL